MGILVDFQHPKDCNFFKYAIEILSDEGYEIYLTVLNRGNLVRIVEKEFPEFPIEVVGDYFSSKSDLIPKIFARGMGFLKFLKNHDVSLTMGYGGFLLAWASSVHGVPSLQCYDDVEYRLNFHLTRLFSTCLLLPNSIRYEGRNIRKFNGITESAYLHPNYFHPSPVQLEGYGLSEGNYIFVRAVSGVSLNYDGLDEIATLRLVKRLSRSHTVLLSLENKSLESQYSLYCTIIQEPVEDVYSLMYYASVVISSGDTMAREASILGTPTIYTGGRVMSVNNELISKNLMLCISDGNEIISEIESLAASDHTGPSNGMHGSFQSEPQTDVTQIIVEETHRFIQKVGEFQ